MHLFQCAILFEAALGPEDEHIDFLETQLWLITDVGLQNYLLSRMKPGEAS